MTFNIFMYTIYSKLEMIYVLKKYLLNYRKKLKDAVNDLKHLKTFYKQIPNILTSTRILSPFIIIPLAMTGNIVGTVIAASLIASTDFFDGLIARKLNITSELGRELDAVSDKFFASALIIPLILQSPIFLANIFFEGMIATTNLKAKIKGLEPKTIFIGKIKTPCRFDHPDATDLHQILIVGSSALIPQGDAFDQTYVFLHQLLQSAFFALLYIFEKQKIPLNIRHDGPLMTVSFPIEP